jgi:hypothetical protein
LSYEVGGVKRSQAQREAFAKFAGIPIEQLNKPTRSRVVANVASAWCLK